MEIIPLQMHDLFSFIISCTILINISDSPSIIITRPGRPVHLLCGAVAVLKLLQSPRQVISFEIKLNHYCYKLCRILDSSSTIVADKLSNRGATCFLLTNSYEQFDFTELSYPGL